MAHCRSPESESRSENTIHKEIIICIIQIYIIPENIVLKFNHKLYVGLILAFDFFYRKRHLALP